MQLFLFGLLVLFNNFVLGSAQNSSSSEVIANGRQNCPAAGSPDYDIIPFYDSQGGMFSTNITSISIVPVNGGPAIAEFPINLNNAFMPFTFVHTRPISPYNCPTCYEAIRQPNATLLQTMVELLNGTYNGIEGNNPTVPCQTDYERPNIVIKFQVNDSRQGEWVITPEHWSGLWPASGNTCRFFITAWPRQPS
uniref:Uncharacterized protein n=1 Tax=Ditylenchus dipsaci TaxID=166011 RepID=A0A915D1G4_9BILA